MLRKTPLKRSPLKRKSPLKRSGTSGARKPKKKTPSKIADELFSLWIRNRDGRCMKCGKTTGLTNSHFWSRVHSSTRYDPDNCDALCWAPCHTTFEHEKQGEYRDWKLKQLGTRRYNALEKRRYSHMSRADAIKQLYSWLKPETATTPNPAPTPKRDK